MPRFYLFMVLLAGPGYWWAAVLAGPNKPAPSSVAIFATCASSNLPSKRPRRLVGNYHLSQRFSISLNLNYSTGRPITLPLAKHNIDNAYRVYYSDRNAYRVPDYLRSDLAFNIDGSHKLKKLAHNSWTIAIYNLTGSTIRIRCIFSRWAARLRATSFSFSGSLSRRSPTTSVSDELLLLP